MIDKEERENLISYLASEKQFAEIQFKALGIGEDQTFAQKVNSCIALANESKNKISFTKEELDKRDRENYGKGWADAAFTI